MPRRRTDVSQTDDGSEEYGEIKVFSANGRLGRVRYIGYSVGLSIVFAIVIAMAVGLATLVSPDVAVVVAVIGYVAMMTVQFLVTIQRAHDMNVTGWLSLI